MRLYLDTEFTALEQSGQLLSLALLSEDDIWFYAVFTDVDTAVLSPWHQEHVVPFLSLTDEQLSALPENGTYILDSKSNITMALRTWLTQWMHVEIWADVPAYDWVFFCELFGGALHIPENIHYIVRDMATLLVAHHIDPDTDRFALAYEDGNSLLMRHNALGDAWACKLLVERFWNA